MIQKGNVYIMLMTLLNNTCMSLLCSLMSYGDTNCSVPPSAFFSSGASLYIIMLVLATKGPISPDERQGLPPLCHFLGFLVLVFYFLFLYSVATMHDGS